MTQAIIYIRFSTAKQERGDSRERQLGDAQAYCAAKGWEVVEVVENLGVSAYKGDHLNGGNLGRLVVRVGRKSPSETHEAPAAIEFRRVRFV